MASNVSLLEPLDVIVVGAGIAGLTAAIAIRRAGHNVKASPLDLSYLYSLLSCEFKQPFHHSHYPI